jgi:hypothetical protein
MISRVIVPSAIARPRAGSKKTCSKRGTHVEAAPGTRGGDGVYQWRWWRRGEAGRDGTVTVPAAPANRWSCADPGPEGVARAWVADPAPLRLSWVRARPSDIRAPRSTRRAGRPRWAGLANRPPRSGPPRARAPCARSRAGRRGSPSRPPRHLRGQGAECSTSTRLRPAEERQAGAASGPLRSRHGSVRRQLGRRARAALLLSPAAARRSS